MDLTDNDFIETFAAFLPADKAPGVREVLSSHGSVDSRNGKGGTAYGRVREQIADAKAEVEELKLFPYPRRMAPPTKPRHVLVPMKLPLMRALFVVVTATAYTEKP